MIGQTNRNLSMRYSEHIRYIKNNDPQSAYAQHILRNIHELNVTTANQATRFVKFYLIFERYCLTTSLGAEDIVSVLHEWMSTVHWRNNPDRENRSTRREVICVSATLSIISHTCTILGSNLGFCSQRPATNSRKIYMTITVIDTNIAVVLQTAEVGVISLSFTWNYWTGILETRNCKKLTFVVAVQLCVVKPRSLVDGYGRFWGTSLSIFTSTMKVETNRLSQSKRLALRNMSKTQLLECETTTTLGWFALNMLSPQIVSSHHL
jgi:hypothetical protein